MTMRMKRSRGTSSAPDRDRSKGGVVKTAAKFAAVGAFALSVTAVSGASSASAATTPRCVDHNYVFSVTGGCDGLGGPGHDRMDIECWANNSDYWVDWYGPWHNRYGSWQETRLCGFGWHAGAVWFEHKNT